MANLFKHLKRMMFVAAVIFPSTVQAQQYFCNVNPQTNTGVPPSVTIVYSGNRAQVSHGWYDGPVQRDVRARNNDGNSRMNYTMRSVGFGGARATLAARITHDRNTNSFLFVIDPQGYRNTFSGSGVCTPG